MTFAEAAEIVGASRSTAYRVLVTLEADELVERLPDGGYRAGRRLIAWATRLLSQLDVRGVAGPALLELRDQTGETVNLAVLFNTGLVYTDIIESDSPFRMADNPGSLVPIHATALGKAIGAYLEPARLGRLVGPEPYEALTPHTPVRWAELSARLADARDRGFAIDLEERTLGVVCVAAAILVGGTPIAAISVSGPKVRLDDSRLHEVGQLVATVARNLSQRLSPSRMEPTISPGTRPRPGV
jgi:DNA-binding IclR family transcriptional regulator